MPPIPVTRPTLPPFEEYTALIEQIWNNRWLTNSGPLHEQLKADLTAYLSGIPPTSGETIRAQTPVPSFQRTPIHLSLFTNGHQALEAAIHALHLPAGSEVITTPYTFASTTHAIVRNNLKPVFCDISYTDYNIDVTKIQELITDKTSAILPVHVYGTPCNVHEIDRIAHAYNLKVIYDAAHAFGVELNGRAVASFGDASMLSFHATKVFHTVEGGAVVSASKELIDTADRYKNFGMEGQEDFTEVGTNAKMSEFHAAMGIANLRHVAESIAARKKICEAYDAKLKDVEGIKILRHAAGVEPNYAYYPIVIEDAYPLDRDALALKFAEHEIFPRKYFFPIVTEFSCYCDAVSARVPVALDVSRRVLSLPLYDTMDLTTTSQISDVVLKYRGKK